MGRASWLPPRSASRLHTRAARALSQSTDLPFGGRTCLYNTRSTRLPIAMALGDRFFAPQESFWGVAELAAVEIELARAVRQTSSLPFWSRSPEQSSAPEANHQEPRASPRRLLFPQPPPLAATPRSSPRSRPQRPRPSLPPTLESMPRNAMLSPGVETSPFNMAKSDLNPSRFPPISASRAYADAARAMSLSPKLPFGGHTCLYNTRSTRLPIAMANSDGFAPQESFWGVAELATENQTTTASLALRPHH